MSTSSLQQTPAINALSVSPGQLFKSLIYRVMPQQRKNNSSATILGRGAGGAPDVARDALGPGAVDVGDQHPGAPLLPSQAADTTRGGRAGQAHGVTVARAAVPYLWQVATVTGTALVAAGTRRASNCKPPFI